MNVEVFILKIGWVGELLLDFSGITIAGIYTFSSLDSIYLYDLS